MNTSNNRRLALVVLVAFAGCGTPAGSSHNDPPISPASAGGKGSGGSPASSSGGVSGAGGEMASAPATGGVTAAGGAPVGTGGVAVGPGTGGSAADGGATPSAPQPGQWGAGAGEVPPTAGPLGKSDLTQTGLGRHDALICGEWQKTAEAPGETIFLIRGGKVAWKYSLTSRGGDEFGDCTLTSYGTVFFQLKDNGAREIKVDEQKVVGTKDDIVWSYQQDPNSEVHAVQPMGKDRVMVMQNGNPAKLMIIDKTKAKVCTSASPNGCIVQMWNPTSGGDKHGMFRHVRILANGNLLIPYTGGSHKDKGWVIEYKTEPPPSTTLTEVWKYNTEGSPWAAVRLKNGNTLISGNQGGWIREVDHNMPANVVWKMDKAEFPAPVQLIQGAMRLGNGNTIIANWCGPLAVGQWKDQVQYFEITPDKKAVWMLKQWAMPNLGPGSSFQVLSEPGVPENPGELAR